jgi:N-acetylglucosaminyl-diphospho-decaprenol L-rhamnosyltransferase
MPRTCAILINYRGTPKTLRCLTSLVGHPVDTIRVVDNSASAEEALLLSLAVQEFPEGISSPAVSLTINEDNLGFGTAVNRAIRDDRAEAQGHDYYLVINSDAEATPGMVETLVSILERDRDVAIAAPRTDTGHGGMGYLWYGRLFGTVSGRKTVMGFPYLTGCCLLFGKGLADEGPVFDESFFMYGEDTLLSWRVQKSGRKIVCADDARVMHEGTGSSSHGGFFYEYHTARCHALLAFKTWERPHELPLFILGRVLSLSIRALIRSIRYRTLSPALALLVCWLPLKVRPDRASTK